MATTTHKRGFKDRFHEMVWPKPLHTILNLLFARKDIWQVTDEGTFALYLRRWFLIGYDNPLYKLLGGRALFLHYIAREDEDRHLHSHPWTFHSLILYGGYREEIPWWETTHDPKVKSYRNWTPFDVVHNPVTFIHRIVRLWRGVAYTLVLTGQKAQSWGFFVDDDPNDIQFVNWKDYINN